MKAVILAGGFGTRLRPLTLDCPKPIVPIFERPFLYYQVDLLRKITEIDEVILSLNYRPERIEDLIGNGKDIGIPIRYMVEPEPLGTGGAIKFASKDIEDSLVVLNGDVLTLIDLPAVIRRHRENRACATIVLTPVNNPSAYGLVETDTNGQVLRFLEKPSPDQITCDTINAGVYILEPHTFDRIPDGRPSSIERDYFPSLITRKETFIGHIDRGYWLDIGSPESYMQAHRDLMAQRCAAGPFHRKPQDFICQNPSCQISAEAKITGPCFFSRDCIIEDGAQIGPESILGPRCRIAADTVIERSILWGDTVVDSGAVISDAIVGKACHISSNTRVGPGALIGSRSVLSPYTRV
ncbi:MAG: nucleotidyltransferase [Acidobacteria bacterium]|nr:nucleotidyltransferase [Acidobacteriota bacterium]|tara:strand:- start:4773 stop:5831 length:1059 start_codon:yes stop_codon:yes gene_type:complete